MPFRPALQNDNDLKNHPRNLTRMWILFQQVQGGTWDSAFLTSLDAMLELLVCGAQCEQKGVICLSVCLSGYAGSQWQYEVSRVGACRIQFFDQEFNLGILHWEHAVLTGLPRMSQQKHSDLITNSIFQSPHFKYSTVTHGQQLPYCYCSVAKSCLTFCDPMDCSMPASSVLHLPESAQSHVQDAILDSNNIENFHCEEKFY